MLYVQFSIYKTKIIFWEAFIEIKIMEVGCLLELYYLNVGTYFNQQINKDYVSKIVTAKK